MPRPALPSSFHLGLPQSLPEVAERYYAPNARPLECCHKSPH